MFSKWSVSVRLSWWIDSVNITIGSLINRCAKWLASVSSNPLATSFANTLLLIGDSMSLYSLRKYENSLPEASMSPRYWSTESYLDLGIRCKTAESVVLPRSLWPLSGGSPRSNGVRSSTAPAITFHRTSWSARWPRKMGAAAVTANINGATFTSESYRNLACRTSEACIVTCRHEAPIPKPMESM
ncbi:hypothetical protein OGAPHI_001053 [Ogataea philodendri]|uniref:Uncharacterized protein n=1 Tax=Ogataea philodendri TaxID=1378263 RepID=A0A9P8PE06_9ASCO|nr:uncharacterized protein OGAPHI_001053 [Ogataea philodendri]KAH3670538.1 hypothetical protein OGAPHI_001053 [Ogataea philodendri]